jgi:DNA-binding response OmpR family regulator
MRTMALPSQPAAKGPILGNPPLPSDESYGGWTVYSGGRTRISTTLLIVDESIDVGTVVKALKARGLRPAMLPLAEDAREIVSRSRPHAVILQAGLPDWLATLLFLGHRGIPCVLLGTREQLRRAQGRHPDCLPLLLPVEPDEIAHGVELVIDPASSVGQPEVIDLGLLQIDLRSRAVVVDGEVKVLPPKEFEILVQLALQPEEPLDSVELLRRVWRGSDSATVDVVHTAVWRLRRMIGDHERSRPLILNRRGFGYLLRPPRAGG